MNRCAASQSNSHTSASTHPTSNTSSDTSTHPSSNTSTHPSSNPSTHPTSHPTDPTNHPSSNAVTLCARPTPTRARTVLVGDSGVGKSSLVKRMLDHAFAPSLTQTIGVDFRILRLETSATRCPVKLEIWDTAGEERFLSITSMYFRDAPLLLLCYDRTDFRTLRDLRTHWLPEIARRVDTARVVILLVATKYDVPLGRDAEARIRRELEDHWVGAGLHGEPVGAPQLGGWVARGQYGVVDAPTNDDRGSPCGQLELASAPACGGALWKTYPKPAALHHVITSAKDGSNVRDVFQLGADLLEGHALLRPERPPYRPGSRAGGRPPCCAVC